MRRKSIRILLIFALLPLLIGANPLNDEAKRYQDWQQQMESLLNEYDLLFRFSAGVLVRRLDANHARLRVGLAGRVPNHSVKWQALRSTSDDLSDPSNLATSTDGWSVAKERNKEGPGNFVEYEETIEIGPEAEAIAVTITPVANSDQPAETVILQMRVLLMDSWVFTQKDIDAPEQ
jgi:hypothetical protein